MFNSIILNNMYFMTFILLLRAKLSISFSVVSDSQKNACIFIGAKLIRNDKLWAKFNSGSCH